MTVNERKIFDQRKPRLIQGFGYMKKLFSLLLIFLMLFCVFPFALKAEPDPEDIDPFEDISTPYILLMEAQTGTVIYERNGYEKAYPASTTKLMTALLVAENVVDLDKMITIGWRAVSGFGSTSSLMGLVGGEVISIRDVLYGLMMRSGNDSAKALAIEVVAELYGDTVPESEAIDKFVELMNAKAVELGMVNTHFATVDGRHNDEHYTTAYDFAILMQNVLKNDIVAEVIGTVTHDVAPTNMHPGGYHLENSNKLICKKETDNIDLRYKYCIGGKTGETNQAGYCLASAATKDDITLILIQFGDNNRTTKSSYRYKSAKTIYDWGFGNFHEMYLSDLGVKTNFVIQTKDFSPFDEQLGVLEVEADISNVSVSGALVFLMSLRDDPANVRIELHVDDVYAPIEQGDIVGTADYYIDEVNPITVNLIALRSVASSHAAATPVPVIRPSSDPLPSPCTPPPGSGKSGNIRHAKVPGDSEYSVWIYYDGSLYTVSETEWNYLYCTNGSFCSSSSPEAAGGIILYKQVFDSNGAPYYTRAESVDGGGIFVIVSTSGYALSSEDDNGTLIGQEFSAAGDIITADVPDTLLWYFESYGSGYRISQSSEFLTRDPGSGLLFWIVLGSILLLVVITVIFIAVHNRPDRRRNRVFRQSYRSNNRRRHWRRRK